MENENVNEVCQKHDNFLTPVRPKLKPIQKKSTDKKGKSRTPSGQILSTSVKDIRNFFYDLLPHGRQSSMKTQETAFSSQSVNSEETKYDEWKLVRGVKGVKKSTSKSANTTPNIDKRLSVNAPSNLALVEDQITNKQSANYNPMWRKHNRFAQLRGDQSSIDSESDVEAPLNILVNTENPIVCDQISVKMADTCDYHETTMGDRMNLKGADTRNDDTLALKLITEAIQKAASESTEYIMGSEDEPQVIDIRTVIQMFHQLQIGIEKAQSSKPDELIKLKQELALHKRKSQIMSGVVCHLGEILDSVEDKLIAMEHRSMRRHIVISGLETSNKISTCVKEVKTYLKERLKVEIEIIDCFKLGQGTNKPVVILVDSITDRATLFQAMDVYRKACVEEQTEPQFYCSDYTPAPIKEARRKERDIFRNNEKDTANQISMSMEKTGLKVEGAAYQPPIKPPEPTQVLSYTDQQLDSIYELELNAGEKVVHEESTFIAYSIPVNAHLVIENAYMKLRLKHPTAKSISCSFSIPGMPRYKHEDFCDDKEIGAGRLLMNIIKKNQLTNIAIFAVRIQKSGNIGPKRFQMISQAVQNAMKCKPFNRYTNSKQELKSDFDSVDAATQGNSIQQERGRKPIRLNNRRVSNRGHYPRQIAGHIDSNKKRRRDSLNAYDYKFDEPKYLYDRNQMSEWFTRSEPQHAGQDLGASWPSLQQSAANNFAT